MMKYDSKFLGPLGEPRHVGVGLVVSNDETIINVLWDYVSHIAFCTYEVVKLNPLVIHKVI